jgi:hypothetical protein
VSYNPLQAGKRFMKLRRSLNVASEKPGALAIRYRPESSRAAVGSNSSLPTAAAATSENYYSHNNLPARDLQLEVRRRARSGVRVE